MPTITVAYWNIENFGTAANGKRGNYLPLCSFIARAVLNMNADILCIMELKQAAITGGLNPLALLQETLEAAMPGCSWYYDWLPGALDGNAAPNYATFASLAFTQQARQEGYAIFWKQNIAKFIMQHADNIDSLAVGGAGGFPANTQSGTVRARAIVGGAVPVPTYGLALPGDILVPLAPPAGAPPGWQPYILPAGTTPPGGAAIAGPGGPLVAAGAAALGAPMLVPANTTLPAGTTIGAAGVQLNVLTNGVNPIVIPGHFILTDPLTLPGGGTVLVPEHMLSLVLTGRPIAGGGAPPFVPGGGGAWQLLNFADGLGAIYGHPLVTRRPAYCTILVNIPGAPLANRLIPITVYHTPLNALPLNGMGRGALCRSLYQAFNHAAGAYINNTRAVIGGDFNQDVNQNAAHFTIYTDTFANGGANCNNAGVPNIRANLPYPLGGPGFPDYPVLFMPPYVPAPRDNPANRSTILLIDSFAPPIASVLSVHGEHYRRSSYDNIFYRGFTPAQAPLHPLGSMYDLIQAVLGGAVPQIPPATVQLFQNLPIFNPLPGVGIPSVVNAGALLADLVAGNFTAVGPPAGAGPFNGRVPLPATVTPARRAAEFIRLFVSDHFPTLFQMQL